MALDPRTTGEVPSEPSVMPSVAKPRSGLSGGALAALAIGAALILFLVLNARRQALEAPATILNQSADTSGLVAAPPPLFVPEPLPPTPLPAVAPTAAPSPVPSPARPVPAPTPAPQPQPAPPPAPVREVPPARGSSGPALVIDTSAPRTGSDTAQAGAGGSGRDGAAVNRSRASTFSNRSTTVPQGSLIPAVLETALDSTRAGFARAIVSRNVMSFDGSQTLIPRGSRLIGEYGADTSPGQNRALIIWQRLIRADGVTISLESPVTDTVGRGGVHASVNSHFFERFSGAILQSALDVGVNLASRAGNSQVILALPGTVQGSVGQVAQPRTINPTLSVKPGKSISVFVARDLDFSGVVDDR